MKIIIAGDGDTGCHLARLLSAENQDVVLIGTQTRRLEYLDSNYNILTLQGKSTSPSTLKAAGVSDCDIFVAVTPWENCNLLSAQIARDMGAGRTLARISSSEYAEPEQRERFMSHGIDMLVLPEKIAAGEIAAGLRHSWLRSRMEIHGGEILVATVKLLPGAPLDGTMLHDLRHDNKQFHVSAIRRGHETIIPRGDDMLRARDILYLTFLPDEEHKIPALCGITPVRIRRVMIAGAGKTARLLAAELGSGFNITAIDSDRERCEKFAAKCRHATVVNSDFRRIDVLREERISEAQAFVALSDSAETNIVSSMVARDMGVAKTVAEIEELQYLDEANRLDIDSVVNKKLATSGAIYQMLLDTSLNTPRCLALEEVEVAEVVAAPDSRITRSAVKDLHLPREMTLGGLVRDGKGVLVNGDTRILPGDHVVVFCLEGSISRLMRYFQ